MKKLTCSAEDCQNKYEPNAPHQLYCSDRCRWRDSKRKTYERRIQEGLCPQCGDEMDHSTKPSYCRSCQKYFNKRYKNQKNESFK